MKRIKETKGITLIALVITIIVMLILVGVTLNVVLNNGLMENATFASQKQKLERDKEMLFTAALGYNKNGQVDLSEFTQEYKDKDINGYKIELDASEQYIIATNEKDNITLYITSQGDILDEIEVSNPWKVRGLTSSNIKFDKTYKGNINYIGQNQSIVIKSNGGIETSWDGREIANQEVNSLIENGIIYIKGDNILCSNVGENSYLAFVFESEEELIVYGFMTENIEGPIDQYLIQNNIMGVLIPIVDVISNPWQERGLISSAIQFDKTYKGNISYIGQNQNIVIKSNGGIETSWDGREITNQEVNSLIENGTIHIKGYNILCSQVGENTYLAFVFKAKGKIVVYAFEPENIQGPIDQYLLSEGIIGTLEIQD